MFCLPNIILLSCGILFSKLLLPFLCSADCFSNLESTSMFCWASFFFSLQSILVVVLVFNYFMVVHCIELVSLIMREMEQHGTRWCDHKRKWKWETWKENVLLICAGNIVFSQKKSVGKMKKTAFLGCFLFTATLFYYFIIDD